MKRFQEFDTSLSQDYSMNYWSDDAILYAQKLVAQFEASDWDALEVSWRSRSTQWQNFCAQVLPWGDHAKAGALLAEMVQSPNAELRESASEALRELQPR